MKRLTMILLFLLLTSSITMGCNHRNIENNSKITPQSKPDKTMVDDSKNIIKASGVFAGQIDSHSIEIMINGDSKAFELGEIPQMFEALKLEVGDGVIISYEINDSDQLVLSSINRNSNTDDSNKIIQVKGNYIGQIDTHSIEVNINGELKDFQILDVLKKFNDLNLKEGEQITFSYQINNNGLLVIKEIAK